MGELPSETEKYKALVVGIKFRNRAKVYDYLTDDPNLSIGAECVVESGKGVLYGEVAQRPRFMPLDKMRQALRKLVGLTNEENRTSIAEKKKLEEEAYQFCMSKVAQRSLKMKLVSVEFLDHQRKAIFYFTSDGRVDFRGLVKDLAHKFKTRIEMRQIGVRDEAKMLGGIGPCGRKLCCATFMHSFDPVTIRMAKDQDLTLNPSKISGLCGRLMCCLSFEHRCYKELKDEMPSHGDRLITAEGEGRVVKIYLLEEKVLLELEDGKRVEVRCHDPSQWRRKRNHEVRKDKGKVSGERDG
jgi:cell fate regulator YaaT (PSP1 superfamily)